MHRAAEFYVIIIIIAIALLEIVRSSVLQTRESVCVSESE